MSPMDRLIESPHEYSAQPAADRRDPPGRRARWLPPNSLRVRLYSVVALLFMLVIGLGVFGFARLSAVNHMSEVIRNHWLRDTRILGDISNYMSDFRTAEATRLLSSTAPESDASEKEIAALGATVAGSQRAYEELPRSLRKLYCMGSLPNNGPISGRCGPSDRARA